MSLPKGFKSNDDREQPYHPSVLKMSTCDHKGTQECFHTIWGFGVMCHKCKKVIEYNSLKQELDCNACPESHYHKKFYNTLESSKEIHYA